MERLGTPGIPDPVTAWNILKQMDDRPVDNLDVRRLTEHLRTGVVPDELSSDRAADLVVSTVHRAKGLEFDRVVVVAPGSTTGDDPVELGLQLRRAGALDQLRVAFEQAWLTAFPDPHSRPARHVEEAALRSGICFQVEIIAVV